MLKVKNIFGPTIQGEGKQAGLPAIFIRFAGCNIWDGREETRRGNPCYYCDTDFRGGDFMTPLDVVMKCNKLRDNPRPMLAVLTGGEPLLQPGRDLVQLIEFLKSNSYVTQIETNGTQWNKDVTEALDFITVSPKRPKEQLKVDWNRVDCLKLLYPHPSVKVGPFLQLPHDVRYQGRMDFCIQPIEEGNPAKWEENTKEAVTLVKSLGYPWRLSLQTHKMLGEE